MALILTTFLRRFCRELQADSPRWFYVDRAVGGDCHYCHSHRLTRAGRAESARRGRAYAVLEQPEAARIGLAQFSRCVQKVSARLCQRSNTLWHLRNGGQQLGFELDGVYFALRGARA